MLIVVSSRHYMDWETYKEDGTVCYEALSEETTHLMLGVYTSVKTCSRAIAEFVRTFGPDENEMEGPIEGFTISLAEIDKPIVDGHYLMDMGVFDEEDEIYTKLSEVYDRHMSRHPVG